MERSNRTERITTTHPQLPLSELYKEIELTEEERKAAIEKGLFEARYQKSAELKLKQHREKILADVPVVNYTKEQLKDFLSKLPDFDIDSENERVVDILCAYFSEDPSFEKYTDVNGKPFSCKKGLLIFGPMGVGKTMLMELFRNNQKFSYQVVPCQDVEATYAKNGPDSNEKTGALGLRKYFGLVSLQTKNQYGQDTLGFMFDDLGQEEKETNYFGTKRNVMREVLSQRYRNRLFESTHMTTNLSADQIGQLYDLRVRDRMKEMFNLVTYPSNAKSRRV